MLPTCVGEHTGPKMSFELLHLVLGVDTDRFTVVKNMEEGQQARSNTGPLSIF